jgi:hypothetical protein
MEAEAEAAAARKLRRQRNEEAAHRLQPADARGARDSADVLSELLGGLGVTEDGRQPAVEATAAIVSSGTAPQPLTQQALHAAPGAQQSVESTESQAEQTSAGDATDALTPMARRPSGPVGSRSHRAALTQTDELLLCPISRVR